MTPKTHLPALCAAALAAATIAGPAGAQSNVTLYGVLDAGIEYSNDDANSTVAASGVVTRGEGGVRLASGAQQAVRLGVRGTEDLGGGLRAIFAIEHRFDIDTGNTSGGSAAGGNQRFWNGQAWVGLQGGWGRLTAGRQFTPVWNLLQPTDVTGYHFYNNVSTLFNNRFDNSIEYRSPTFGGFNIHAMYGFGENLETSTTPGVTNEPGDSYALGASWRAGGFYLAGAYTAYDRTVSTGTDRSEYGLGGQYRFSSQTALGGGYVWSDRSGRDTSLTYVSASVGIGAGTVFLNYVMVDEDTREASNRLGLAWSYPLSKRTNAYVATGLATDAPLGTGARLTYTDPVRIAVGVRHLF